MRDLPGVAETRVAAAPAAHAIERPGDVLRFAAIVFAAYLVFYVLAPIAAPRLGVDESWRAFLTWAFEHGKQFGTDVVFTYGPWGFLSEPRGSASAYPWLVSGRLVLTAAASSGIALFGASWIRRAPWRWAWAAAVTILADPSVLVLALLFLFALTSAAETHWKRPVLWLLAFAAGLAACSKFTVLLLAVVLVPVLATGRRTKMAVPVAAASFLFFWLLGGQRFSNLPVFVRQSLEVAGAYGSAMVLNRPSIEALFAVIICGLPLVHLTKNTRGGLSVRKLACLGWLGVCELVTFRHALARSDDPHLYLALIGVGAPVALLLLPLPVPKGSATRPAHWKELYCALIVVAVTGTAILARGEIQARAAIQMESFRSYPAYLRAAFSRRGLEPTAEAAAAPVDVFPIELSYAIVKGLPLRNRPVIQSYAAFSRKLCEMNAAFFDGSSAPRVIYFDVHPLDNRLATMEDSLAWRSLLTRYAPTGIKDGYLVLERRRQPSAYELRPLLDRAIPTDHPVDVPEAPGSLIWAELEVERTFTGRLLDLFYRKEKMLLDVETGRRALGFTLLDETAGGGFLLSPVVNSQAAMLDAFRPEAFHLAAENVRRMSVHRGRVAALGFSENMRLRLYAMRLLQPVLDVPGGLLSELGRNLSAERRLNSVEFSPALVISGDELRLVAGSPSSGWMQLPPGRSIRLRYGTDGTRATCSGAVRFRALLERNSGEKRELLWEDLRQSETGAEWSAARVVPLPAHSLQSKLYLEIDSPEGSCGVEGAYWSELRVDP